MWRVALIAVAAYTFAAQADILHMRDGSRHYGTLISADDLEIVFRISLGPGESGVTKRFPRALVKSIEGGAGQPPAQPEPARPADDVSPTEDFEQMLREAFELIDDQDAPAAVRALQRAVVRAPGETLPQLDEQCRTARGVGLAELLAETRIEVGMQGGGFQIHFATPYEAAALGRLLESAHDELLARRYHGRSISEWSAAPKEYDELQPDARQMVADARRAAGMLGARVQFDPRLRDDREQRRRLIRLRADVARFVAHVTAMRGYTEPPEGYDPENPAAATARRLAAEQVVTSRPATSQPADTAPP